MEKVLILDRNVENEEKTVFWNNNNLFNVDDVDINDDGTESNK